MIIIKTNKTSLLLEMGPVQRVKVEESIRHKWVKWNLIFQATSMDSMILSESKKKQKKKHITRKCSVKLYDPTISLIINVVITNHPF